jgi:hypothetical protein
MRPTLSTKTILADLQFDTWNDYTRPPCNEELRGSPSHHLPGFVGWRREHAARVWQAFAGTCAFAAIYWIGAFDTNRPQGPDETQVRKEYEPW